MACWHVLKSRALWEHHSKHRLHHFPARWPGRLEFIIICAVVQGNKSVLLFRKSPVICFVPRLHAWHVPCGENGAWKGRRLLWVSNIKVPVNKTHRRSTRTRIAPVPEEDETSDTFISIKIGEKFGSDQHDDTVSIWQPGTTRTDRLWRKMLITPSRVLFSKIIPSIICSC